MGLRDLTVSFPFDQGVDEKMSIEYDALLERHRVNVKTGYSWIKKYMSEILESGYDYDWYINAHDLSKRNKDEYYACDAFIFGDRNDIEKREKS